MSRAHAPSDEWLVAAAAVALASAAGRGRTERQVLADYLAGRPLTVTPFLVEIARLLCAPDGACADEPFRH